MSKPIRWTRRAKVLGVVAVCVAGFALGLYAPLWDAMPWAVTLH